MSGHKKRLGFLSFGHWGAVPGSQTPTAQDALLQSIELAVAAEEIGIDGAYFRVHHFAKQFASPFPLLSAIAAKTNRIEMGTGVIDMRYENPLYMAEEAAATDLISGGRLQLGISRGSPEPALHGPAWFGYQPKPGTTDAQMAQQKSAVFLAALSGQGIAPSNPNMTGGIEQKLPIQPQSPGLMERIWWGSGSRATAELTGKRGLNLMSSTLLLEDEGTPFDELQAEQIALFRASWSEAGHERIPRVSVSRSVIPIVDETDRALFGDGAEERDQVGILEGVRSRFGKSYTGRPDALAKQLANDQAVQAADTVLLTVPNQLGVDYNARMLRIIAEEIAPALGWEPNL
ncbi:MAG: LLM class flavin-dependent oxidoreductase [Microbacteriaceae bacterium]